MKVRNPVYNSLGTIDCEIEHPAYGWIPFTASPNDPEEYGAAIYKKCLELEVAPYVAPIKTPEQIENEVRAERNRLLLKVDAVATHPLRWADLTPEEKEIVAEYRRNLLDITNTEGFPVDVVWPHIPDCIKDV